MTIIVNPAYPKKKKPPRTPALYYNVHLFSSSRDDGALHNQQVSDETDEIEIQLNRDMPALSSSVFMFSLGVVTDSCRSANNFAGRS